MAKGLKQKATEKPAESKAELAKAKAEAKIAKAEAAAAKKALAKAKAPKGIPTVRKQGEPIPRPDEIMAKDLATAQGKEAPELTEQERVAVEREIRRYVSKSGGFREGLPDEKKEIAIGLLEKIGRDTENPQWDTGITVPGFRC